MSINLTTIALTIFVICAGFVLLRGAIKILLGCLVLGLSAWIGFRVWQLAPDLVKACLGIHLQWLATVLPIAAFLVTFLIGRLLVRFLASPFRKSADARPPLTLTRLLGVALFTLIPTCLIVTMLAILIHHAGSVAEIQHATGSSTPTATANTLQNIKSSVENFIPAAWLKLIDPLAEPTRVALAKIITEQSQPQRPAAVNAPTGQTIPRATVVNDPELQNLAREGKFAALLHSPLLTQALNDPKVQALLKNFQH